MKKVIYTILPVFLMISCNHESWEEKISRQADEFTKTSCPKQMDLYTVLDSLTFAPDSKVMTYYYSVSDKLDSDSIYNSELLGVFHTNLMDNIRQNIGLLELKEHSITFRYSYRSSTCGREYMSFIFTPEDYK